MNSKIFITDPRRMLRTHTDRRRPLRSAFRFLTVFSYLQFRIMACHAAELTGFDFRDEGDGYRIQVEMTLDVAAEHIKTVLTDFRHIYRLNPSIVESRVLNSPERGATRVYTRIEGCVAFYCTEVTRVEDVRETDSGELVADIVPGMSDFDNGKTLWRVARHGEGSRLTYESFVQPGFFVPPLIGTYLFRKKFKEELTTSFQRIECNARARLLANDPQNNGRFGREATRKRC